MKFIIFLFSFIFLLSTFVGNANALVSLNDIKALNYKVTTTKEAFFDNSDMYSAIPNNEKYLSYEVRLPVLWSKVSVHGLKIKLNDNILSEIAEYYGPAIDGRRSSIRISAMKMADVTSLEHWYVNYVVINAYTLQGYNKLSDNRIEGLYVVLDNGVSFVVRTAVVLNGGFLTIAEYKVPIEFYRRDKDIQIHTINSFNSKNLYEGSIIDSVNYPFLDIANVNYPVSWYTKRASIESLDYMHLLIAFGSAQMNKNRKHNDIVSMRGRIDIKVFSKISDPDPYIIFNKTHMFFEDQGFMIDVSDNDLVIDDITEGFKITHSELLFLNHEKGSFMDYELWDVIVESEDYLFLFNMVTPAREDDFEAWSRNYGALKYVVRSLR